MKKLFSILIVTTLLFFSFSGFVDAKSRSGSSSSSFKSSTKSSSSGFKSSTKSSSTVKSITTTPKASNSTKTKKSTTKPKTTVKSKIKKSKVTISNPGGPFYKNGSYVPYLMLATGAYLVYQGMEDDGDPIYVNAETGEEVDDDDLESLGAKEVESIPDFEEEEQIQDDVNNDSNEDTSILGMIFLISFLVIVFGFALYFVITRG